MATVAMETKQEKGWKIENAPNLLKLYRNIKPDVGNWIPVSEFSKCAPLLWKRDRKKPKKIKIAPHLMKLYRNIKWDVGNWIPLSEYSKWPLLPWKQENAGKIKKPPHLVIIQHTLLKLGTMG